MNKVLYICIYIIAICIFSIRCSDYDVIVVGSGPGGSVAAARAVQDGYSVLVVERGKPYNTVPAVDNPAQTALTRATTDTGSFFTTTPQPTIFNLSPPKSLTIKDAAYAGGATAINGEIHVRGNPEDYFNSHWPRNWGWDTMLKYYKKYETYHGAYPTNRGRHGPVHVTERRPEDNPLTQEFINATIENWPNVHVVPNINSAEIGVGTSAVETTSYDGHRVTSYSAYIRDLEQSNSLTFLTNTLVKRVLFNNNNVATGIEVINTTDNSTRTYTAKKAVIISAGALGTPQLLQRSGIGKASDLTALGINVVSDLPEVGQNLDDHSPTVTLIFNGPAPWVNNEGVLYGWLYWNTKDRLNRKTQFSLELNTVQSSPNNIKVLSLQLVGRKSRGNIKITSTDPRTPPALDLAWLSNQDDFEVFTDALDQVLNVINILGWTWAPNAGNYPCNPTLCFDKNSTAYTWIKSGIVSAGYHFSSTAKIGKVVDKKTLAVKGTKRLYVCDASIFPLTPHSNSESTVYAVSERAIDLILDDIDS